MIRKKYWCYNYVEKERVTRLSKELSISDTLSRILINRNIDEKRAAAKFLEASLEDLYDPFLLKDMDKAVNRIRQAIDRGENIWIYGDYDVDGISSTSIMLKYFQSINYPVNYYIPNRMEEGYGLNKEAIKEIKEKKGNLIITVDCGITSAEEVAYAQFLGIDMIITDHHECQNILPEAFAIINPKQRDCHYPFNEICGCGLAFKLIQALTSKEELKKTLYNYIDIVAIATVADVVPLVDENRVIVKNGLKYLPNTSNVGIQALLKVCGLSGKSLGTGHIAFTLAPRINAAGRISSPDIAVQLLIARDFQIAYKAANILNEENLHRQEIENNILKQAMAMIEEDDRYSDEKVLVLWGKGWHHGVIGIVASRIVEKYHKPAIVLGAEEDIAKGSARSIPGFNLFEAMSQCKDLFMKFGGHEQAAGLSIKVDNLDIFRRKINMIADSLLCDDDLVPKIYFDEELDIQLIGEQLLEELERLEPFGMGNPSPKFMLSGLTATEMRKVGTEEKHLKLKLNQKEGSLDGIGFGLGPYNDLIEAEDDISIICMPEYNTFNGDRKIQLNVKDIKITYSKNYRKHPILKDYYKYFTFYDKNQNIELSQLKLPPVIGEKKEGYILKTLENTREGESVLIIINTLEQANRLLWLSQIKSDTIQRNISVFHREVEDKDNNNIHMLINPNIDKIQFKRYNKIILCDLFFSTAQFARFLSCTEDKDIVLLYIEENERYNEEVLQRIVPSREELVLFYKYMKSKGNEDISICFENIFQYIKSKFGLIINERLFEHSLKLFNEGNLLTFEIYDGVYHIKLLEPVKKIDITKLAYYQYLLFQKKAFENFKNEWIQLYMRRTN